MFLFIPQTVFSCRGSGGFGREAVLVSHCLRGGSSSDRMFFISKYEPDPQKDFVKFPKQIYSVGVLAAL